jgi:pimeloyl-ACP methyl ester carboxylesterase
VLADDLAWLCYELGLYRPVVLGHGLGGRVALDLALRYPDLPATIAAVASTTVPLADDITDRLGEVGSPPESSSSRSLAAAADGAARPVVRIVLDVAGTPLPESIDALVDALLAELAERAPPLQALERSPCSLWKAEERGQVT